MTRRLALAGLMLGACVLPGYRPGPSLAQARVSSDFATYEIRRVGLLPFQGRDLTPARSSELQRAFQSELSESTPFEIVLLDETDLGELQPSEPHRQGAYHPRTIIDLSERYRLDGLIFGTVTQERFFPPLLLSLQLDLVSAETGLVVWSASLHLDADDPRVIEGLKAYYYGGEDENAWQFALLSPERFARFAAFQVACLL